MNIRRQFHLFLIAFLWLYQVHGGDETLFHRGDVVKKHPRKRNISRSQRRLRSKSDSFAKSSTSAKSANAAKSSNTAKSANSTKSSSSGKSEGATKSSSSGKSTNAIRSSRTTKSVSSTKSTNATKNSNTAKSSKASKSSKTSLSNFNSYDQLTPTPTPTPTPIYSLTPTPNLFPSSIVSLHPTTQTSVDTYPSVSSTISIQPSGDPSRFPSTRIVCSNNDDRNSIISDVRYTYEMDVDEALDMQESIRMFQKKILNDISSSFGCHDESHRNLKYKIKQGGLSNKIYELRSSSLGGSIISNKCQNYKRLNSTCAIVEGLVEIHHGSVFTRAEVSSKVSKMIRISGNAYNNANIGIRVTLLSDIRASVTKEFDDESPSSDSPLTMRVFPLVVVCAFCFSIIAIFVVRKGNQKYYIIGSEQSFPRPYSKEDELCVLNEDERLRQHALVEKDLPLKLVDIEVYKPKIGCYSDEKYYRENTWSLLRTKRKHRRPLSTIDECDSEESLKLDENEKRSKATKTQGTQSDLTYDPIYDKCFFSSRRIVDSDSSAFVCIDLFADDECQR